MVTEMAMGKTLAEAGALTNKAVAEALGGLPPKKMHCSNLAADALHLAIADFLERSGSRRRGRGGPRDAPKRRGALVALSGGVDSAVTALRLVEQGRTLEAAMVRLWPGEDERSCCSPGALQRARQAAAAAGIPFHVIDGEHDFVAQVVEPFVDSYLAGETPNPCVACNPAPP